MKTVQRLFAIFSVMMLVIMTSCSNDSDTVARELLSTVPSNAGMVLVADGEQMVDKAGGKGDVLALARKKADASAAKAIDAVAAVWDPTATVLFSDGYYLYLTTRINDGTALRETIDRQPTDKMIADGDLYHNTRVAILGDQVWVLLSKGALNPTNIKGYAKMAENQSFVSNDYCDTMLDKKEDVTAVFNISSLLSLGNGSFQQTAMARMALSALFDDAAYVDATLDFGKGEAVFKASVLTSKYKKAKFLLPVGKVDPATVRQTAQTADVIMAMDVNSRLVEKIRQTVSSFGGGVPAEFSSLLNPLDGTIAVAAGPGPDNSNLSGVITTNGQSTIELSQMLASMQLTTATKGNLMTFTHGSPVSGKLNVADASVYFDKAFFGAVSSNLDSDIPAMQTAYFMLTPDGGGLAMNGKLLFADKNQNSLRIILQSAR